MSFDPTTDPAIPDTTTREPTPAEPSETQRHRDAMAAFDKVYLPLRHKVGTDDNLELSIQGDDVHALLFLCELGLLAAGVDPDRAVVGG